MKSFISWLKFHWIVPKGPFDNTPSIDSDNDLAPNRRQAIILTNADAIHRRIYAALEEDELNITSNSKR